jgi:hypothetical protein
MLQLPALLQLYSTDELHAVVGRTLMYCLHISSRSCTMLSGWPSMGTLVRPAAVAQQHRINMLQTQQHMQLMAHG